MKEILLSGHLYRFEVSQAADQQLQVVDVDGFAIFGPKAGRQGIQIEEEQLAPSYHLNPLMLSQSSLWLGTYTLHFQALGDYSGEGKIKI